jgi:hypothetical protein
MARECTPTLKRLPNEVSGGNQRIPWATPLGLVCVVALPRVGSLCSPTLWLRWATPLGL